MVKKIVLFFAYVSFFIVALIYFTPKVNSYYFAETQLKPLGVIIGSESVNDNGFSLEIKDAKVFVKSIESATIGHTNIKLLGLYNSVSIENILLSSTAKSFVPLKIQSANITYHVFNPLNINGDIMGEFGEAKVFINLLDRTLKLILTPSNIMKKKYKSTLRNFKKSENGELIYDKTF